MTFTNLRISLSYRVLYYNVYITKYLRVNKTFLRCFSQTYLLYYITSYDCAKILQLFKLCLLLSVLVIIIRIICNFFIVKKSIK